ncbi:hypothetical protein PR048_012430 [Dryococelus australis]|uniref:Uncharacterized protein n=1 Tax=Dryococelus australis TaxID=614101 RepID=A0ABQ9HQ70_9NEOP|nr:hypothetical protein PR048_012430 [Dryococelus australis]
MDQLSPRGVKTPCGPMSKDIYRPFTLVEELSQIVKQYVARFVSHAVATPVDTSKGLIAQTLRAIDAICDTTSAGFPPKQKLGSIPGEVAPGFSHVRIVPDDAAVRWVFSGVSRFPRPCTPTQLLTLPASQISSGDNLSSASSPRLAAERDTVGDQSTVVTPRDSRIFFVYSPFKNEFNDLQARPHNCVYTRASDVFGWLLSQRVASVTSHLAVWHSLCVSLQVYYSLRVVQGVSNKLRSNCKVNLSVDVVLLAAIGSAACSLMATIISRKREVRPYCWRVRLDFETKLADQRHLPGTIPTCENSGANQVLLCRSRVVLPLHHCGPFCEVLICTLDMYSHLDAKSLEVAGFDAKRKALNLRASHIKARYRQQDCKPVQCFARRGDERVTAHVSVTPSAPTRLSLRRARFRQPGGHLKLMPTARGNRTKMAFAG